MNKENISKIIAFLLALVFRTNLLFAQGVEESPDIRGYLDNMFSTLDKTRVPDGLLRDFAFELVDLDKYSGSQLNDQNLLDRPTYEMLLRTIHISFGGQEAPSTRTAPLPGGRAIPALPRSTQPAC